MDVSHPSPPGAVDVGDVAFAILAGSAPRAAKPQPLRIVPVRLERVCRRCGIDAHEAAQVNEPICSENGLVASHSYIERPVSA